MGVVVVVPGGLIVDANLAFATLVGYPLEELIHSSIRRLIHPDDQDEIARVLARHRWWTGAH